MNLSPSPNSAALFSTRTVSAPHATVLDALEAGAKRRAPFVTFHTEREPISRDFALVLEQAHAWSSTLRRHGVSRGARVLLLMPTGPAFIEAFFGVLLAGAVPVPLASPMTFGSMARYLRNLAAIAMDAGAQHLIASKRVRDAVSRDETLATTLRGVFTEPEGNLAHESFAPSVDSADLAFIQYTSGTTGHPKGVMVSHRAAAWVIEECTNPSEATLPRREIAQLLGMLPETLSRALATLARRGAIDLTRQSVAIRDIEVLESCAHRESAD